MRYTKYFAGFALAVGLLAAGTPAASAQNYFRQDLRRDGRRVAELRAEVARDRARLNEDLRRGRRFAAARDREELARDERALHFAMRDVRRDWR